MNFQENENKFENQSKIDFMNALKKSEMYRSNTSEQEIEEEVKSLKYLNNIYFIVESINYSNEDPEYKIFVMNNRGKIKKKYTLFYDQSKEKFLIREEMLKIIEQNE